MHPLAHHAGEQTLAPLLLLAGSWLPILAAMLRDRLAAARGKPPRARRRPDRP